MAKDYAKITKKKKAKKRKVHSAPHRQVEYRRQPLKKPPSTKKGRAAVAVMCMVVAVFYISQHINFDVLKHKVVKALPLKTAKHEKKPLVKPHFEFYTLLQQEYEQSSFNKQVDLPENKKVTSQSPSFREDGRFILQLASFKQYSDADKMKAELILKGYLVTVAPFKNNGYVWYRVRLGPFDSLAKAKKMRKKLEADKFRSLLKRVV